MPPIPVPSNEAQRLRAFQTARDAYCWLLETGVPRFLADGIFDGVTGSCTDSTSSKQAEVWQQQANQELIQAMGLKDAFLANMSHEVRMPLNLSLGTAESREERIFGPLNEQQISALGKVERGGSHLLALVNRRRIVQVLENILTNAIPFTPAQGIIKLETIYTCPLADAHGIKPGAAGYLFIAVTDTGIGIDPQEKGCIFQLFIQLDSGLNRSQNVAGLGLHIVKQLVELHGGYINVTSKLGVGSCFMIALPYRGDKRYKLCQGV